jgi:hypothetical protein
MIKKTNDKQIWIINHVKADFVFIIDAGFLKVPEEMQTYWWVMSIVAMADSTTAHSTHTQGMYPKSREKKQGGESVSREALSEVRLWFTVLALTVQTREK